MQIQSRFQNLFDHPFLGRGFRPFFFLGAVYSVINLFIWGGFYAGFISPPAVLDSAVSWHAHEMIYGYTIAIVAGFLLTAVANWTGGAPTRQLHLLGLCLLWIAGRVVMNFDFGLPVFMIAGVEGAFLPALAISLSIPLLKSWNVRNFVFLVLLIVLFVCDMVFLFSEARVSLYIAIMVIVMMNSLVGGRIIPAFSVAAIRRRGGEAFQTPQKRLDILAMISIVLIIVMLVLDGGEMQGGVWGIVLAGVSFVSAGLHILRMRRYHTRKILNDPLVWILHAGFGWLIIGLVLLGFSALEVVAFGAALHAFTAGLIGSMTLGMMCRVTLGHTGRNLVTTRLTAVIFVGMQCAAILRVALPIILPEHTGLWIIGSAFLWSACFALYVVIYTPMLWQARPDRKPA